MAYIEAHQALAGHFKTRRTARTLSLCVPTVVGHLLCLWWWALDNAPDGDLTGLEAWEIAEAAQFDGDADAFLDALMSCGRDGGSGFLERTEEGRLLLHDWHQYGGKLVDKRENDAYRLWLKRNRMEDSEEARSLYSERRRTSPERRTDNQETSRERRNDVAGRIEKTSLDKRSLDNTSQPPGGAGGEDASAANPPESLPMPGLAGGLAGGDMPDGRYPEGWLDAETVSPEVLLNRFKAAFPDSQSPLAGALATSPKPVAHQAKYLRPFILRCLRGEEPDPITPALPTAATGSPSPSSKVPLPDDETIRLQKRYLDGIPPEVWPELEQRVRKKFKIRISTETAYSEMQRLWRSENGPVNISREILPDDGKAMSNGR